MLFYILQRNCTKKEKIKDFVYELTKESQIYKSWYGKYLG